MLLIYDPVFQEAQNPLASYINITSAKRIFRRILMKLIICDPKIIDIRGYKPGAIRICRKRFLRSCR